ncbi:MAG: hypothetical protein RIM83_18725 [Allomuricauda sp.]
MKKALQRYLFPLCILLLGGFINLYADSQSDVTAENACYLQNLENQHSSASFHMMELGLERKHCAEIDVEEQEEKEEEVASHTISLQYGGSHTAFFYVSAWGQSFIESNTNQGFSKPKAASSIKRHVRFQVFRI